MNAITDYAVGDRVRAVYPNERWGSGVVVDVELDRRGVNPATGRMHRQKPLIVRRDGDGEVGHFHLDQVEAEPPFVVGDRVSYEDSANGLRVGTVAEKTADGQQCRIVWDDDPSEVTYSDMRQHGWRRV